MGEGEAGCPCALNVVGVKPCAEWITCSGYEMLMQRRDGAARLWKRMSRPRFASGMKDTARYRALLSTTNHEIAAEGRNKGASSGLRDHSILLPRWK